MKKLTLFILAVLSAQLWALDVPNPTNPTDGAKNAYTRQQFYWATVSGAGSYELQVDTTLAFNSPLLVEKTFTTNSQQLVYHFHYNTRYYWRMRSVSKTDTEVKSDWCKVRQFTTLSQVDWVSPNNPEGSIWYYPQQDFVWKNCYGSTRYVIEVDTTKAFNSPVRRRETYTNSYSNTTEKLSKTIGDLYMKCTTYWRVKAYNENDSSDWSTVAQFDMIHRAEAQSPDSLQNAKTALTLEWKYQQGLSYVIIELDTTDRFDSPIKQTIKSSGSSQSNCYCPVSELLFGQDYYWRLKSYHQKDTTEWSKPLYFHTYSHCNLTKDPQDSATEVITSPQLNFNYTSGISNYQMQLDTTPLFNSPLLQDHIESASSQTYAYHVYSDLLFGTTYYRRVRECLPKDTSDWSPIRCFTTVVRGAYSTTGSYASIAKGATGIAIKPKLYYFYRNYIDSVEIQIDTTEQFDSPLFQSIRAQASNSQQYAYEYPKSNLLYGTTYYWRIRNSHSKDVSEWTFPRYFTTLYELPKPILIAPEDRTPVRIDSVVFTWHPCKHANGDATQYTLQLAWDSEFDSIYQQITVTDTTTWLSLPDETSLFWRVQGENSRGKSPWSEVRGINPIWSLPTPELMTPAAEAGTYTRVAFKWHSVPNADTYLLQVCRSNKFDIKMAKDTAFADTLHNINQFWYGQDYYWRVRAVNKQENLISKWSEVRHFRTSDSVTLDYADDTVATKNYYSTQTLRWFNHVGSTGYVLEIDTMADFTSRGKRSWNVTGTTSTDATETITQQVSQLYLGCFNYWRVKAANKNDTSHWSEVRRFHTRGKAEANYPSDSLTNSYTKRNFGWKYFNGLDSALIQLDTAVTFDSPALRTVKSWAYNQTDAYAEILNMYFGKRYYWRVANFHRRDTTEWSDTRTFTTYDWGAQKSPSNGATYIAVQPKLTYEYSNWLQAYMLQVDTATSFDSPLLRDTTLYASSQTYAYWQINRDLLYGTTYYWRVADVNKKDTSNWSVPWAFTTTYQLPQPTLCEPANQTIANNGEVVCFVWNTCEDATKYVYQLSDDGQFRTYLHQEVLTDTTTSLVPPGNSILYWRIQAINSKGRSPWSNVRGINTSGTPTSINVNVHLNHNSKVMRNGQLLIIHNGQTYNAQGQKL